MLLIFQCNLFNFYLDWSAKSQIFPEGGSVYEVRILHVIAFVKPRPIEIKYHFFAFRILDYQWLFKSRRTIMLSRGQLSMKSRTQRRISRVSTYFPTLERGHNMPDSTPS